jgi:hypothetical protein
VQYDTHKLILKVLVLQGLLHFDILSFSLLLTVTLSGILHLLIFLVLGILSLFGLGLFLPLLLPLVLLGLIDGLLLLLEHLILHVGTHVEDVGELNPVVELLIHEGLHVHLDSRQV